MVYRTRLNLEQIAKIKTVARLLGCNGAQALRAMIDAVTVETMEPADYAASLEDVEQELSNG